MHLAITGCSLMGGLPSGNRGIRNADWSDGDSSAICKLNYHRIDAQEIALNDCIPLAHEMTHVKYRHYGKK